MVLSSNLTGSMQLNGPTVGNNPNGNEQLYYLAVDNGSNPTGSMQQRGPTAGSDSNLTGSMEQHGPTISSGSNPTGYVQIHHPSGCSDTERKMPERTYFQDSNSLLDNLKGDMSEEAGLNQHMQDGIDQDTLFGGLPDLPNFIDENYSFLYNSEPQFGDSTLSKQG